MSITPIPIGQPTFLNMPRCEDLSTLDADIAIIGVPFTVPYDLAASRQVSSNAPEKIRKHSNRLAAFLQHHDFDFDGPPLGDGTIKIVDCGDVTMQPGAFDENAEATRKVIDMILSKGAVPFVLGGDHAVPIPVFKAYENHKKIHIVQVDAHIDWREERNGVHEGLSSVMRRGAELPWVTGMTQVGIRTAGSARTEEFEAAKAYGATLIGAREVHERGIQAVLDQIPDGENYYITLDADGLDPSIAPGVRSQAFNGLTYQETFDLFHGVAQKGPIVGFDVVEVVPQFDIGGITSFLSARIILNTFASMIRSGQFGDRL